MRRATPRRCTVGGGKLHHPPLQVDMLLMKKLWREMIERRCVKCRILTVSEYKRVDEEEGDG